MKRNAEIAGWRKVQWGQRYGLSRPSTYRLFASGNGPRLSKIPGMSIEIVTIEADREWRSKLPAAEREADRGRFPWVAGR